MSNVITQYELNVLREADIIKNNIKLRLKEEPESVLGLDKDLFFEIMSYLHPSTYGKYIQDRYIYDKGLESISSLEDRGDCMDVNGNYYELKTSFIDSVNSRINVVQIRPWQNIDFYDIITIDKRENPFDVGVYRLSKNDMEYECSLLGSTAHITSEASRFNKNKELRFTLKVDPFSWDYIRWEEKYRVSYGE